MTELSSSATLSLEVYIVIGSVVVDKVRIHRGVGGVIL